MVYLETFRQPIMTSDLCEEDVIQITTPQLLSTDALVSGGAPRVQASSAAVELGRRLLLAARAGDTAAVLDLMAKGAPFTTDWLGTSPLHLAAANGHVETCAVLLRAGVTRDSRTKVERTPLHLAAHAGHADACALLLDHGAIVDCRDMLRMTPLHWAAARGHAAAARALLRRGADVRARCKFRHTPRALALRHRHHQLAALLLQAETDAPDDQADEAKKALGIENLTKAPEIKLEKSKVKSLQPPLKQPKLEPKVEQQQQPQQQQEQQEQPPSSAAAQLLRKHGITLLPADDGSTVLNAIQSGRTVVLSDAGKLMLKESGGEARSGAVDAGVTTPTTLPVVTSSGGGVVLRATPVRAPPRGVKVYSVNHKLLPAEPRAPVRRVIDPHDLQQVKLVQLSSEAGAGAAGAGGAGAGGGGGGVVKARARRRSPVKIVINKTNFTRLVANARPAHADLATLVHSPEGAGADAEAENRQLRAQLAAARAALAGAAAELRACRARLALYEPADQ